MKDSFTSDALFDLTGRVAVITGGAGLLGKQHAAAIASAGGTVVLADISEERAQDAAFDHSRCFPTPVWGAQLDVTNRDNICSLRDQVLERFSRIDILVNN